MFKKTLMSTLVVLSFTAHAATDNSSKVANDYDCTINELQAYMGKKTESMVQRESAIAPFDDFMKGNVAKTSASTAGGKAPAATNPDGTPKEECNYFWGDLEDIKYERKDDSGLLDAILSGDINGIVNASKDRITEVAEGMTDEIKKGVCKRLSTENVKKTVIDYSDDAIKGSTGYDTGDITDPDMNGFINDGLKAGFGNTGKLINVFDPAQDKNRSNVIFKETDRQAKEMMKMN
jgi:hypothetical protein